MSVQSLKNMGFCLHILAYCNRIQTRPKENHLKVGLKRPKVAVNIL